MGSRLSLYLGTKRQWKGKQPKTVSRQPFRAKTLIFNILKNEYLKCSDVHTDWILVLIYSFCGYAVCSLNFEIWDTYNAKFWEIDLRFSLSGKCAVHNFHFRSFSENNWTLLNINHILHWPSFRWQSNDCIYWRKFIHFSLMLNNEYRIEIYKPRPKTLPRSVKLFVLIFFSTDPLFLLKINFCSANFLMDSMKRDEGL